MAEKTEKATPKKLKDARQKGQVAKSQDAGSALTFIVSIAITIAVANTIYTELAEFIYFCFGSINAPDVTAVILAAFYEANLVIFRASVHVCVLTAFFGVLFNFLLVGPGFSSEAFVPDIQRFNPVENIKAKFKLKTLVELIKQILKIVGATVLIYTVVDDSLPAIVATVDTPIYVAMQIYADFLLEVIKRVGIFFLCIGVFDLWYQRHTFAEEMKMEKHEVKQEHKNSEGDPQIKSKRKQIAQEIAFSEGPQKATRRSKAVVTNPTHIAVAIAYTPEEGYPLPYICAMGEGKLAELIIKEALSCNIPVLRNVSLARLLYEDGEVWDYIPKTSYEAVAEVLKWVANVSKSAD